MIKLVFVAGSLEGLENHPRIKCCLRYSETLNPELLKKLLKRGQIELVINPVLALIPDEDKLGQLKQMNQHLKTNFFKSAQGVCLTAGAWEPHYPKLLKHAGVEYCLVDEELLLARAAGAAVTEYDGEQLTVLPVARYLSQFSSANDVMAYLKQRQEENSGQLIVLLDDAEKKFQPAELFDQIETSSSWLELTLPESFMEENQPQGLVYLSSNSDSLYAHLLKDGEANNRHKKIQQVSRQLKVAGSAKGLFGRHEKEVELEKAKHHLYQAEQGVDVYRNLILAEAELDKVKHGAKPFVELVVTDFDQDGRDEVILANNLVSLYFSPYQGSLFELDYKPKAASLLLASSFIDALDGQKLTGYDFLPLRQAGEVGLRLTKLSDKIKLEKTIYLLPNQSIVAVEYDFSGELDGLIFGLGVHLKSVDETKDFTVSLGFSQKPASPYQWELTGSSWKLKINLKIE